MALSLTEEQLMGESPYSRSELDRIADRKVAATSRLAYDHNEFIHRLFKNAGMNPHLEVTGRKDLLRAYKQLVRTKSTDLQNCRPDYLQSISVFEVWSSGSTSQPKKVLRSADDLKRIGRGQLRSYRAAGVKDGQRVLIFPASPPYGSSLSSIEGLKTLNVHSLVFSTANVSPYLPPLEKERLAKSYIEMIEGFNPDFVRGSVWALHSFAKFLTLYGFDAARKLNVQGVIFSSDPTTPEARKEIGQLWNCEGFDVYSSTETSVLSYECKKHLGMHANESDVFLSVVDPANGEEVAPGESGMDLVTSLYEETERPGTFLLNYSHGDHIRKLPESCSCGLETALMDHSWRDTKKKVLQGFGFDVTKKENKSLVKRGFRKVKRKFST